MAHHAASSTPSAGGVSFLEKNHFLFRRLHSLTGIVPIGGFVCFHLFTNMQMLFGTFQHEVNFIHNMPALLFMEIFVLWLPIAFHAVLGIIYTFSGKANASSYKYESNWRYTLQRITGILAFIFIFLHIATLRWRWDLFGWYTPFFSKGITDTGTVVDLAHYSTSVALSYTPVLILYIIGVMSAVYHWSNGLWTAAITWGATISVSAQKRWGMACVGLFMTLTLFTAGAIVGAISYLDKAPEAEKQAYVHMAQLKKEGKLDFHTMESIFLAPTGSTRQIGHAHDDTVPHTH